VSDEDDESSCKCPPSAPAWLATFADLMSLLMCFFVLLLSFSEMDAMKFKRLAGSMAQAFGVQAELNVVEIPKGISIIAQEFSPGRPEPTPINEIWQSTSNTTKLSLDVQCSQEYDVEQGEEGMDAGVKQRIKQRLEELVKETEQQAYELAQALHEQIVAGEVEVETRGRKIIIRIREKGSFPSGSANLNPEYREVMSEVRSVLALKPGSIVVQGHSDDVPIHTARFRSNWELSAARAVSVAHELMLGGVVPASRFEVSGKADTLPLVPNTTPENRARNRRVEIVIQQGLADELTDEDKALLQTQEGKDILRELDIAPKYLFELDPNEIF
jgi:Flagellar motor protein